MVNRRDFCADCWFADLDQVRDNLRILADDIDALISRRPLAHGRGRWHAELLRAGVAVQEAHRELERVFELQGCAVTEQPPGIPNDLN